MSMLIMHALCYFVSHPSLHFHIFILYIHIIISIISIHYSYTMYVACCFRLIIIFCIHYFPEKLYQRKRVSFAKLYRVLRKLIEI